MSCAGTDDRSVGDKVLDWSLQQIYNREVGKCNAMKNPLYLFNLLKKFR
jgi:hypothetical protein